MLRCAILTTLIHLVQVRCQKYRNVAGVSFTFLLSVMSAGSQCVCVFGGGYNFLHIYIDKFGYTLHILALKTIFKCYSVL